MPPTSGDDEVGDALRHQFGVRVVTIAGHAVRHDRREQAFDGRQHRDRERRRQQRQDQIGAERGNRDRRQAARDAAELRADGLHRQLEERHGGGADEQRDDRAGHAREPPRHEQDQRERGRRDRHRRPVDVSEVASPDERHPLEELARDSPMRESEEVLDLRRGDQQRDAVREAEHDRARDELHRLAQPGEGRGTAG